MTGEIREKSGSKDKIYWIELRIKQRWMKSRRFLYKHMFWKSRNNSTENWGEVQRWRHRNSLSDCAANNKWKSENWKDCLPKNLWMTLHTKIRPFGRNNYYLSLMCVILLLYSMLTTGNIVLFLNFYGFCSLYITLLF